MTRIDLDLVRERLSTSRGPAFWRSLEELAATPEFEDVLHREFPRQASEWIDGGEGFDRRRFLQLSTASLALAGLTACTRQPIEKIVPYVKQPEQTIPGRPLYYATASTFAGYAMGVLAETHHGRPTKLEGNPEHPASVGKTDAITQAAVLGLYDPDRSQVVTRFGEMSSWTSFMTALRAGLDAQKPTGGKGIRILSGRVTSPSLGAQFAAVRAAWPGARWHRWEPIAADVEQAGAVLAFGAPLATRYDLAKAQVVVTLDADLAGSGPAGVRYSVDLAKGRRVRHVDGQAVSMLSRIYAIESTPSPTGSIADHRLALRPSAIPSLALALAAELGVPEAAGATASDEEQARWVAEMARDLTEHQGACVVAAGEGLPAGVHALVHAMNERLGNLGTTVLVSDPVEVEPVDNVASLRELTTAMAAGEVELLLVLGANPLYDAPADLDVATALAKVPLRIHHGLYHDETAEQCHWHVPAAHDLESWGDARAYDGTVTLQQPMIEPLYGGHTTLELLELLVGPEVSGSDIVRRHWSGGATSAPAAVAGAAAAPGAAAPAATAPVAASPLAGATFDRNWRHALHDGFVADSALPHRGAAVDRGGIARAVAELRALPAASGLDAVLRPDPSVWDGRYANNGWLQELPKPFTKLTWDNALLVAPATAQRLGIGDEDVVKVTVGGRSLEMAVWVLPGQAVDAVTIHLGQGRRRGGRIATRNGFATYALRGTDAMWWATGVTVEPTGGRYELASTQQHHMLETDNLEGREAEKRGLVRVATVTEWRADPHFARAAHHAPAAPAGGGEHGGEGEHGAAEEISPALFPDHEYPEHAWGMSIDLGSCTGCNACVIACQAENNIPIVGKEQVRNGREMHWIRIDRYFHGADLDRPAMHHQPMLCQQCEKAPCEVVCPVAATVHSAEGLNDMVYNRCVGTRYCSNNCPYKVRRFNFLKYNDYDTPVLDLLRNPDVTVRSRGVMEKCTYCVQRISHARIEAKKENRRVRDGEVVTACQQVCPSDAIVFGDINDPASQVAKLKAEPTNYGILEELNTVPRTTYLAKVRNPNPRLETPAGPAEGHA